MVSNFVLLAGLIECISIVGKWVKLFPIVQFYCRIVNYEQRQISR